MDKAPAPGPTSTGARPGLTDSRRASLAARAICAAFDQYQTRFRAVTRRARARFERQDWAGAQSDAAERLEVYRLSVEEVVAQVRGLLDERLGEKLVWASMKAVYSGLIAERDDWDLAETFFNSITRKIFATVGLDPQIEFVDTDFETPPHPGRGVECRVYRPEGSLADLLERLLADYGYATPFEDQARDARLAAARLEASLDGRLEQIEMVKAPFYRGKGAYLVGRSVVDGQFRPLALTLLNGPAGLTVDAILLRETEVDILFSFTRSYFLVEVERPYDLVRFLQSFMPHKRLAELYISIGYNKHGKTELYRHLLRHLARSEDRFEAARGEKGMVMVVFTLPSYNVVFKLIRDRFAYPKDTTRREVMAQYQRVFQHDRAGRLVDAQEFEHLKFERARFTPELLEELARETAGSVSIGDDYVVVHHAYVERRVNPLNLYLREAEPEAARSAVLDCGQAIKDLAAINIFTGDMLLKNFGVTRLGRVVFYDYDELSELTGCRFRPIPEPDSDDQALASEPWYSVAENDVFPEEFPRFLGLRGELKELFHRHHADLFDLRFWQSLQARLAAGEIIDIFPYGQAQRLRPAQG